VLHTWTRSLQFHPHAHCIVTGGGLHPDGDRWVSSRRRHLFPVRVLSRLFRGKFLAALAREYNKGHLDLSGRCTDLADRRAFAAFKDSLYRKDWVVYAKRPFAGSNQVFRYLGRYTHRVGLSNRRLVSLDARGVTFRTRGDQTETLAPNEFLRRFLLHVLPKGFVKIRHHGLMAASNVNTRLAIARRLLECAPPRVAGDTTSTPRDFRELLLALTGVDLRRCPRCGAAAMRRLPLASAATDPIPPDTS
jgi:hypothetical protein